MMRERIRAGIKGQAVTQAIHVLVQVLSVPIFLSAWPVPLYGEWLLLAAIPAYLTLGDHGLTVAATNNMAIAVSRGDHKAANQAFQSCALLLLGLVVIIVLVLVPLALIIYTHSGITFSYLTHGDVRSIILLLALNVVLIQWSGLAYASYYADGQYGRGAVGLALTRLVEQLVGPAIVLLLLSGGPVEVAGAMALGRGLSVGLMLYDARRQAGWLRLGLSYASTSEARRLMAPAAGFSAFPLGNALNLQGVLIVIGATLGASHVATFSVMRTATRFALQLLRSIAAIANPEISRAYGARNTALLRSIHRRTCGLALWVALGAAIAIGAFAAPLLDVWTNGKVVPIPSVLALLILGVLLNPFWYTSLSVLYATNRHMRVALWYVLVSGGCVLAAAGLTPLIGLDGAALSILGMELIMVIIVLPRSLRSVDDALGAFVRSILRPSITGVASTVSPQRTSGDARARDTR